MAETSAGNLTVQFESRDGATIVSPSGDVDLNASPILRQELKRAQGQKPDRLVINLEEVPYMDSSGVATLVEAMQHARRTNTKMTLCCMQDRVRSIFEIARLDTVFNIQPDLEAALKA